MSGFNPYIPTKDELVLSNEIKEVLKSPDHRVYARLRSLFDSQKGLEQDSRSQVSQAFEDLEEAVVDFSREMQCLPPELIAEHQDDLLDYLAYTIDAAKDFIRPASIRLLLEDVRRFGGCKLHIERVVKEITEAYRSSTLVADPVYQNACSAADIPADQPTTEIEQILAKLKELPEVIGTSTEIFQGIPVEFTALRPKDKDQEPGTEGQESEPKRPASKAEYQASEAERQAIEA